MRLCSGTNAATAIRHRGIYCCRTENCRGSLLLRVFSRNLRIAPMDFSIVEQSNLSRDLQSGVFGIFACVAVAMSGWHTCPNGAQRVERCSTRVSGSM